VLRLRTLGGISVVDEHNRPVSRALAQPRPLALVAIVAASSQHGISRDKLLALLWPESSPERARHSLTQALYAARRAFDAPDLFATDGQIRLNSGRIWSDVAAFERALDADDFATAIALYAGPFLDGFSVAGCPDVARWASARRSQLEDRAVAALDALATAAECSADLSRAVEYRKRIGTLRPLDSAAAAQLIRLLARAGNRGEAVRLAEEHEGFLHERLSLVPDPAFTALLSTLRDSRAEHDAFRDDPSHGSTTRDLENAIRLPPSNSAAPAPPSTRRALNRGPVLVAAAAALVIAGIFLVGAIGGRSRHGIPRLGTRRLVVTPFSVSGASEETTYLGPAIVELLAPRLAADSSTMSVDAGTVLAAWRSHGFDRSGDTPRDSVLELAKRVGATRVVVGSVVGTRPRTVLDATVVALPGGATLARATVEGPADSITTLVGQLAAKLLVSEAGESERVAIRWSHSLTALRHFLVGRLADRRGAYALAARAYSAALSADSSFATAALRLAIAADRLGNSELEAEAVARAWTHREGLDERERSLLAAFAGPRYPQPSPGIDQLNAWTAVVRRDARSAESWYQLGSRLFHEGDRLGSTSAPARTLGALGRAVAIDPTYLPARRLLSEASIRRGDSTAPHEPSDDGLTQARAVAMADLWNAHSLAAAADAIAILRTSAATNAEAVDAVLAEHSLALNEGRPTDAFASTRRLHELRPDSHAYLRLRVLDALYGDGDSVAAVAAAADLQHTIDAAFDGFPLERRRRVADGCVVGQWRLAHGDTAGVRRIMDLLDSYGTRRDPPPVNTPPEACGKLLEVALAVATSRSDALARLDHVDSLMFTSAVAGNAAGYAHLLIARLYRELGHPDRALAAIRKRDYMVGWAAYLATTWQEERRLADAVGDRHAAAVAQMMYTAFRGFRL